MEEKNKYYVKVGSGEVLPDKTLAEWEFEIEATEEEASRLETVFEQTNIDAYGDWWRAHSLIKAAPKGTGDAYDNDLRRIYEMLYEFGTEETRDHVESMGVLEGIENNLNKK